MAREGFVEKQQRRCRAWKNTSETYQNTQQADMPWAGRRREDREGVRGRRGEAFESLKSRPLGAVREDF